MYLGITEIEPPSTGRLKWRAVVRLWVIAVFIAGAFYAAVAPTLSWVQFHDPIENLNVATALEMRHGGPWIVPNLQGFPRLAKPPLAAWLTALSIRPATVAALDSTDRLARAKAYDRFMEEARRPALLAAAGMLVAAFWLGYLCAGERGGVYTACLCATEWLFLRNAVISSTDIHLALWVTITNAFLALCVLRQRRWLGCLGAGGAMGFVFIAKGPVGLVQTLLPFAVFVWVLRRWRVGVGDLRLRWQRWIGPAFVGLLLATVVGGWWYAWVVMHHEKMGELWLAEVSRVDADNVPPGHWYKHFFSLYLFLPWLVWLTIGAAIAAVTIRIGRRGAGGSTSAAADEKENPLELPGAIAAILGLLLLFVPLILMSFAKDRFQRYLVPLCPAGALLGAGALMNFTAGRIKERRLEAAHWVVIGAIAVGLPIVMSVGKSHALQSVNGKPLLSPGSAAGFAAGAVLLVAIGVIAQRRWRDAMVIVTTLIMIGVQTVYFYGYGKSPGGRCDLARVSDRIAAEYPTAELYVLGGGRRNVISVYGNELSIYLNRRVNFVQKSADVPLGSRPQILLLTRSKREPELQTPTGWTKLVSSRDGNAKYVFLRLPQNID